MKWTKHHRDIWLDARLRVHPVEVRCLLLDLQALSNEAGVVTEDHEDIALLAGLQPDSLKKALEALQRLGLISILDSGNLAVTSCVEDSEYRDSRRAGGVAARDAGVMPKRCRKDAQAMPSVLSASPLASGSSRTLVSGKESVERKPSRSVKIDPATHPLPTSLDFPDVRAALVDYLTTRKDGIWNETLAAVRLKELSAWGRERAVAALRHSVGYQGLFEPKSQPASNGKPQTPVQTGRYPTREEREARAAEEIRLARQLAQSQKPVTVEPDL